MFDKCQTSSLFILNNMHTTIHSIGEAFLLQVVPKGIVVVKSVVRLPERVWNQTLGTILWS